MHSVHREFRNEKSDCDQCKNDTHTLHIAATTSLFAPGNTIGEGDFRPNTPPEWFPLERSDLMPFGARKQPNEIGFLRCSKGNRSSLFMEERLCYGQALRIAGD